MTQKESVLIHLQEKGKITPLKALHEYQCYRLSDVIHKLRNEGYRIVTLMRESMAGRRYAEYILQEGRTYYHA